MDDIIRQLKRLAVEKIPFACMGCAHEHSCSVHGCAVINKAVDILSTAAGRVKNEAE